MKEQLTILNRELSLKAENWDSVKELLIKVRFLCVTHNLKWADVEFNGFTMMVEQNSDIEALATEYENWILCKQKSNS